MAEHKKSSKLNIRRLLPFLVPFLVAAIVISSLAIAGHITRSRTKLAPADRTEATTAAPTENDTEDAKVTLVAVGDNLIHLPIVTSGEQEDGSLRYDSLYEAIAPYIQAADLAVINQETPLGGDSFDYSGYPVFNTPWEIGDAAVNAGFDVFTCATNHAMDMGTAGVEKELEFVSKYPDVLHLGTHLTEEDYRTVTYTPVNGITFALLNYTYGTNGIAIPEDKPYLIDILEEEKVSADVTEARENADVVIVFPHWGTSNSHDISEQQQSYTQLFSELGVDIVIGTHPHVLQKVEWVTNEDTGKEMLVYYSLGNFISHQVNLEQLCGGMAEITVERVGGETKVTDAKLAPLVTFYERTGDNYSFCVYRLSDYTDDLAARQSQDGATVSYFTELAKQNVSEEFLDMTA